MKIGSAGLAALATAALVAGCGGSSSTTSSSSGASSASGANPAAGVKADPAIAKEVPAKYKSNGLSVAADATYAPNEFLASDGKTVQGMDADLAKALGAVMGVKTTVRNVTFDSIIPGLASGKYDLGMSSFTDTKAREKTVNFVTYFSAGTTFYTKAQGGVTTSGLAGICGRTIAAEKGTTQVVDATAQGKKCQAAGKPGVKVLVFPDQNGVNLAVESGRAQIGMADSPVVDYLVKKSNGQLKRTGDVYGTAPYGIALAKSTQLTKPLQDALKVLIKDGTYKRILAKWGIQAGAITNPAVNAATS